MEKRALSAIQRPALTNKEKEMILLIPNMSYLVTAERIEVAGEDTLVMNFFHAENKELQPAFRTFCQSDDYITQDLTTDKTKWKTGSINVLTGYLYWYKNAGNIVMASVKSRETILDFLYDFKMKNQLIDYQRGDTQGRTVVDTEVEARIDEYQDKIKEWKLQKKHEKEMAQIDLKMAEFGEIPSNYLEFVKKTVFDDENYIFYNTAKKTAFCTRCEHEFELTKDKHLYHKTIGVWNNHDEVRHNKTIVCPYCGKYIQCKSDEMGRQKLLAVQWSVLVQKHEEDVLVRYFCHTKDFRKDCRNPEIETREKFRTVHTDKKAMEFEWGRFKTS